MTIASGRLRPLASVLALAAVLVSGCTSGGALSATRSPSATGGPSPGDSTGGPLSEAELKYRIIDALGHLAFCDPDAFPVAREDEGVLARQHLAEIRADSATFAAIAAHLGLDPVAPSYTADQQLAIYGAWKVLRVLRLDPSGDRYGFDVLIGPDATGAYAHVVGTITSAGAIDVQQRTPADPPACPICLARGTLIATPGGQIPAERIRVGTIVWTRDALGRRTAAPVVEVGSTPVPATHRVVRLELSDGRVLRVSPGHPLADGRPVGSLRPGDTLDGATVIAAELVSYGGAATFDLRPAGPTGVYWADGVPLGSTLSR
jgi:Hint domain